MDNVYHLLYNSVRRKERGSETIRQDGIRQRRHVGVGVALCLGCDGSNPRDCRAARCTAPVSGADSTTAKGGGAGRQRQGSGRRVSARRGPPVDLAATNRGRYRRLPGREWSEKQRLARFSLRADPRPGVAGRLPPSSGRCSTRLPWPTCWSGRRNTTSGCITSEIGGFAAKITSGRQNAIAAHLPLPLMGQQLMMIGL